MSDYRWLIYDTVDDGSIATITLNRPKQRNAQHRGLLVELDQAFMKAEEDDAVKVVVLRGAGTAFSSGHDMGSSDMRAERDPEGPLYNPTFGAYGGTKDGIERSWRQEWQFFFANTRRWRDLRKITIASVHGPVYAGGLMLAWACDLIVADETAEFADVVGARLGMCGVEYFAHPWEFGLRKAKELLLTGDTLSVDEAYRLGMVSKVFKPERLESDTIAFARRIAKMPSAGALMIKEAVNQTQDNMGFYNSLQAAFSLHQLNHAHYVIASKGEATVHGPATGGAPWNEQGPIVPSERDTVKAEPRNK